MSCTCKAVGSVTNKVYVEGSESDVFKELLKQFPNKDGRTRIKKSVPHVFPEAVQIERCKDGSN